MENPEQIKIASWADADRLLLHIAIRLWEQRWNRIIRSQGQPDFAIGNGNWRNGSSIPLDWSAPQSQDIDGKDDFGQPCFYGLISIAHFLLKHHRQSLADHTLPQTRKRSWNVQSSRRPKTK